MRPARAVEEVEVGVDGLAVAREPERQLRAHRVEEQRAVARLAARQPDGHAGARRHEDLGLDAGHRDVRADGRLGRQHAGAGERDVRGEAHPLLHRADLVDDAVEVDLAAPRQRRAGVHDVVELEVALRVDEDREAERRGRGILGAEHEPGRHREVAPARGRPALERWRGGPVRREAVSSLVRSRAQIYHRAPPVAATSGALSAPPPSPASPCSAAAICRRIQRRSPSRRVSTSSSAPTGVRFCGARGSRDRRRGEPRQRQRRLVGERGRLGDRQAARHLEPHDPGEVVELPAEVGDAQEPGEPLARNALQLGAALGDVEERRALADGELGEQGDLGRAEVPAVGALHVADDARAGRAQPQRAVDDGQRVAVLGQLLGELRLLVEHEAVERGDEVVRGGRARGQLGAEAQHGISGADLTVRERTSRAHCTIGSRVRRNTAARLEVATPHAQRALAVEDARAVVLAAHDADGVGAEQPVR